ncbi:MAG: hypothetical protein HYX50_03800 [Chloroflexi bacterium]|nr:hypothetical protein [Chloroflexota bacterium]
MTLSGLRPQTWFQSRLRAAIAGGAELAVLLLEAHTSEHVRLETRLGRGIALLTPMMHPPDVAALVASDTIAVLIAGDGARHAASEVALRMSREHSWSIRLLACPADAAEIEALATAAATARAA